MSDWIKVPKDVFYQIAKTFNADWITHGFQVDCVPSGAMVVIDRDEDCYWFEYYVTKELYRRYEVECI